MIDVGTVAVIKSGVEARLHQKLNTCRFVPSQRLGATHEDETACVYISAQRGENIAWMALHPDLVLKDITIACDMAATELSKALTV